jgi:hypothetical protein
LILGWGESGDFDEVYSSKEECIEFVWEVKFEMRGTIGEGLELEKEVENSGKAARN